MQLSLRNLLLSIAIFGAVANGCAMEDLDLVVRPSSKSFFTQVTSGVLNGAAKYGTKFNNLYNKVSDYFTPRKVNTQSNTVVNQPVISEEQSTVVSREASNLTSSNTAGNQSVVSEEQSNLTSMALTWGRSMVAKAINAKISQYLWQKAKTGYSVSADWIQEQAAYSASLATSACSLAQANPGYTALIGVGVAVTIGSCYYLCKKYAESKAESRETKRFQEYLRKNHGPARVYSRV